MNRRDIEEHVRSHVTYPTTATALKKACNRMSHFSKEDKEWFTAHLPEGNYANAEAVLTAIGMEE